MIKNLIALITVIMMASLVAQAGYSQTNSGFTVTTIALDAADIEAVAEQIEEDTNVSIEGDASGK